MARLAAAFATLLGLIVLIGWIFQLRLLTTVLPGSGPMKANAALCFVLLGCALWSIPRQKQIARVLSILVLLLAAATITETGSGRDLRIDELLAQDPDAAEGLRGRMASATALSFLLLAGSILIIDVRTNKARWPAGALATLVLLIGLSALAGHLYGVQATSAVESHTAMAANTAIGLLALGSGILLSRAEYGWLRLLFSESVGGTLARRLLPIVVLIPLVMGWLRVRGQDLGLYGTAFGTAALVVAIIVVFFVVVATNANSLDSADRERRVAEEERESVFKRLDLLLKSTGEGIYTLDTEGKCTLANRAAAEMLGYSCEELLGRNMHELMHSRKADGSPFPVAQCPTTSTIQQRRGARVTDDVFWRKDGSPITVDYSSFPIVDNDVVRGAVIAFNDIFLRKQLEAQLEQSHRVDSLGRVAATITHEFNNVLMGIQPFADVIRRSSDVSERAQSAAERIMESVKRGRRITEEILRFTRPAEPIKQDIDINQFLEALAGEMRAVLGPAHVLNVESTISPDVRIFADPLQLHQVFSNLILNARDAMPDGGAITIRREPCSEGQTFSFAYVAEPERFVHFSVSDHGTGILPADLQKIFEPLFTRKKKGTGLGLAVAHQIISHHGGLIIVESTVGEGSTFHIFLPRLSRK